MTKPLIAIAFGCFLLNTMTINISKSRQRRNQSLRLTPPA